MLIERWVSSSALFTFVVGWNAGVVSLTPSDAIFAQRTFPLNDIIFYLDHKKLGKTNLSLYKCQTSKELCV
jgi:hypothetical protein